MASAAIALASAAALSATPGGELRLHRLQLPGCSHFLPCRSLIGEWPAPAELLSVHSARLPDPAPRNQLERPLVGMAVRASCALAVMPAAMLSRSAARSSRFFASFIAFFFSGTWKSISFSPVVEKDGFEINPR